MGTLTTSTGSGQIVACIFNNSSGVTSVRGVEKLNAIGGPNRTARLAIVATLVGALSATPVSAFEAQPDKRLTGAITIISDDWTKELEADLSLLASDMWGTQKRLEEKGFRVDRATNRQLAGDGEQSQHRSQYQGAIRRYQVGRVS
jgi:hypothetical protein